ncbi:MAG: hypothetical protein SGJ13_07105 [Actinomycetota bacterium]|nr:hypothetical protein [Actinomycetota bacterium]
MRTGRGESAFTTIQYVATVGFSMVLFVLVANLLVDLYARGVVRDALDEGARSAAVEGADAETCRARAQQVLDDLLRGPVGNDIEIECEFDGAFVVARAEGSLPAWLPMLVPAWELEFEATALREP